MVALPPVTVVGAGGHALVSIEVLREAGHVVRGCVAADVSAATGLGRLGVPVLGTQAQLEALLTESSSAFVAVGDNEARQRLVMVTLGSGGDLVSAESPAASVSSSASIGRGSLIMPGSAINAMASTGLGAIVNTGAIVEHECTVGDFVHIAPGAVLAGNVTVGEGALVGLGARVLPGRGIGSWAVVGAGAVVVDDVPDGGTVVGVPARLIHQSAPGETGMETA